jgi:hypothetical protein
VFQGVHMLAAVTSAGRGAGEPRESVMCSSRTFPKRFSGAGSMPRQPQEETGAADAKPALLEEQVLKMPEIHERGPARVLPRPAREDEAGLP